MINPKSFLSRIDALAACTEGPKLERVKVGYQVMNRIVHQLETELNVRGLTVSSGRLFYHDVLIELDNTFGCETAIAVFHEQLRATT